MPSLFRRLGAQIAKFLSSSADPAVAADSYQQYAKTIDGVIQMFGEDSAGVVYQISPPGVVGGNTISPASLGAGTTNDYAPTGLRNATTIRQVLSGANTITGLDATVAGGAGRRVTIINIATSVANQLILANESASSTAANRFALPGGANWVIPINGSLTLEYDATSSRWRTIGDAANFLPDIVVTPTAIASGTTNNYNPTGLAGASLLRLNVSGGSVILTGIAAQPANTKLVIQFITAGVGDSISFVHESASSTAANRFSLPARNTWWLTAGASFTFFYDGTQSRWTLIGVAAATMPASDGGSGGPAATVGNPASNMGFFQSSTTQFEIQSGGVPYVQFVQSTSPLPTTRFASGQMTSFQSQFRLNATAAIGSLTGTINNQAIADTTITARLTTTGVVTFTGMTGGAAGRIVQLVNVSGGNIITINSEDAGSTAANRFLLDAATKTILPEGALTFWYDPTSARWRLQ